MKSKGKKKGWGAVATTKKGSGFSQWYNKPSKNKAMDTAKKSAFEALSAIAGAGLTAVTNKQVGMVAGLLLLVTANHVEEKTGLLKVAGASALGYAIAKALQDGSISGLGETPSIKDKLTKFKDEVLVTFYLDKLFKKKETPVTISGVNDDTDLQFGQLNLDALDMFDRFNQQQADGFGDQNQMYGNELDFAYSVMDDPDQ